MILATISLFLKGCFVFACYAALAVVNPGGLVPDMAHTARMHPNSPAPSESTESKPNPKNIDICKPVCAPEDETPVQQVHNELKDRPVVLPPVESVKQLPDINDYPPKIFSLQDVLKQEYPQ
jgi:hypothetical protein